jgi:L-lactate dehydrogenase (cytochrome)
MNARIYWLAVLNDELETSMRLLGVTSIEELRPHMVNTEDLDNSIIRSIPGFKSFMPRL